MNYPGTYSCVCDDMSVLQNSSDVNCTVTDNYEECLPPSCVDKDECELENPCPSTFNCYNLYSYFTCCQEPWLENCVCPHGYFNHTDDNRNYYCKRIICEQGFELHESENHCVDIDECELGEDRCNGQICVNTEGCFECGDCQIGYELENGICVDYDECIINNGVCGEFKI